MPLALAILIVFGSAKLLAEIFERLHQPAIVGEILAGVLIGPSVLGWIAPTDILKALSDLGVMFLLFGIGLEVKASDLVRVGFTATLVATLGEAVPFVAGWALLVAWGSSRNEALLGAAAMVATSVGITASVLAARGLLQELASRIILAAAVIDDILGLIVLAVVSGIARGHLSVIQTVVTALLATSFTVVLALWGNAAAKRLLGLFKTRARAEEAQFHFALVALFAMAVLALYTGVAAIVGAFLAGMALSESADGRVRDLTRGVGELLVPFFLTGIGLSFDVRLFRSASMIALAVLMLVVAVVAKLIGAGVAAWSLGWSNMLKIGLGMAPRGEVAMIAAQLGLGLGVLRSGVYSVIVFMVVGSAMVTPLLLKIAFRDGRLRTIETLESE